MTTTATTAQPPPDWVFDGVVRFTRIGTAFLIFTFVIGFAALNTGNNALYIGLAFMLGCLLLSGLASQRGLRSLEVELGGAEEAWAGRPVDCVLRVANRSRIWNVRDLVIHSAELARPVLVALVPRRESVAVNASFLFQRRGVATLKRIDLYTRYPFGFFLKKRRIRLSGEFVVYPRLLGDEESQLRFKPILGEQIATNRPGAGFDIYSFRDYARGDSLRHVYWRKSASLGRWIVKQTDLEAARVVHAVVDPWKPPSASDEAFEEILSAAATFLFYSIGRGLTVILSLPRATFQAGEPSEAGGMFRALALIEPSAEPLNQPADPAAMLFSLRGSDEQPPA